MISYVSSFFYTTPSLVVAPLVNKPNGPEGPMVNNPNGPEGPITNLLPELLKLICSDFDMPLLGKISLVSKKWDQLSSSDEVWKKFENEYEIKAPDLKQQIKTNLKPVYQSIKAIIEEKNKEFYCKLAKTLFQNIQSVKFISSKYENHYYAILLNEENKINFDSNAIFNICVPKIIQLEVNAMGFFFKGESLKINCTKDNYTPYNEIMGGVDSLSFSKWYERTEDKDIEIIWANSKFLNTASKF